MSEAGAEKLERGLKRLAKAGDDPDMLGTALTSIHGALEDRFRHLLATTPEVPEFDQTRVLDVSRVQWGELIDLMRLHRGLSAEDATLVRSMNGKRQAVAHGGPFRGKRAEVERYARFAQGFFTLPALTNPEAVPVQPPAPARAPVRAPGSAEPPKPAGRARAASRQAADAGAAQAPGAKGQPATRSRAGAPAAARAATRKRATQEKLPMLPMRLNPGLVLIAILFLVIGCVALDREIQGSFRAQNPAAPTIAPAAAPLPSMAAPVERTTSEELNMRTQPAIEADVIIRMPAGAAVTVIAEGPLQNGRRWVRVRYGELEGWVDEAYLR
jgi:hypothetical protein